MVPLRAIAMDDFLHEIGKKLQDESTALTQFVEPEHKELAVKTYVCMAECFRSDKPAAECRDCASRCNSGIQQFQQDLEMHVKAIQNNFQSCMQNCALKVVKNDGEELKSCVTACYDSTVKHFQETRLVIKDLVSKYQ